MICQPDEVHVWIIPFDAVRESEAQMLLRLSALEVDRAARFVPKHARRAYVISHFALRRVLSLYVDKVEFRVEARGKPRLVDKSLEFSLSHTNGLAAVAIAHSPVGIDVEAIREIDNAADLAERFLSQHDARDIRESKTPSLRFLKTWTTYEARAKQSGQGLAGFVPPLQKGVGEFFERLIMPSGFVGALSTSRADLTIKYLNWSEDV